MQHDPATLLRQAIYATDGWIEANRPALPAGHPIAWAAITRGTILEGSPYPYPVFATTARPPHRPREF